MKILRSLLILGIAFTSFSAVAPARDFFTDTGKSARSIDEQVYHKLKGLMRSNVFDHITWQVNGGTITLGGEVITLGTRREAASVVKGIPGVTEVINNINELPPSPMDDRIRRAALLTFTERGPAQYFGDPNPDVRIVVENGRMTLEGYVHSQSDSNLLNILANGITGVFEVTNNLIVGQRRF